MNKFSKSLLGVAGIAILGTVALAGPANAAVAPQPFTGLAAANAYLPGAGTTAASGFATAVDLGGTGYALATWETGDGKPIITGMILTAAAPAGTTFDTTGGIKQRIRPFALPWHDLAPISMSDCTFTNADTKIRCVLPNWSLENSTINSFAIPVSVSQMAASNSLIREIATISQGDVAVSAALMVQTTNTPADLVRPGAPIFTGVDNAGDVTIVKGTGVAGATIEITNPAGDVVGTGTVDADGNFSVSLDKDYTGSADDLTMTQTVSGLVSDPTTISAADLPIVNPSIAAGAAGILTLVAAGAVLVRRKRATV